MMYSVYSLHPSELDLLIVSLTLVVSFVLAGLSLSVLLSHRRSVSQAGNNVVVVAVLIKKGKNQFDVFNIGGFFRFLVKKIWPTIPTPESKFQGLFTVYGGDFQVRTRDVYGLCYRLMSTHYPQ